MRLSFPALIVLAFTPAALAASAGQVPSFDVARNCGFEASGGINPKQTMTQCKQDEANAEKKLKQEWSKFGAQPKRQCLLESSIGGERSYVELQTCLEMSSETQPQTVGQAPSNARQKARPR